MWTAQRAPKPLAADALAEDADDDVDLNEFRDVEQDYYAAARLQAVARGRSDRRSLAKAGEAEAKVKCTSMQMSPPPQCNETTSVHPPLSRAMASSGVPRPCSPSSEYSRFPKMHERSPQHFVPVSKAQERFWGSTQASPSGVSRPGSPSSQYSRFPKKTERSPQHYIPVSKAQDQERFGGSPQASLAKVASSRLTKVEADLASVFKNLEQDMSENLVVPNVHSSKPAGRARGVGMNWLVSLQSNPVYRTCVRPCAPRSQCRERWSHHQPRRRQGGRRRHRHVLVGMRCRGYSRRRQRHLPL